MESSGFETAKEFPLEGQAILRTRQALDWEKKHPQGEEEVSPAEAKEVENFAFRAIMTREISREFETDMENAGYTEEEKEKFENWLSQKDIKDQEAILSIPAEIRERRMTYFLGKIREENKPIEEAMEELLADLQKRGAELGYHITDADITPQTDRFDWSWSINGYEYDHRDDMSMAYYSLDHENLFYKRKGKYVYVIQALTGDGTIHKVDSNNQWGRAPRLSIVAKFEIAKVNGEVKDILEKLKKPAN